jgi:hypothetical protein
MTEKGRDERRAVKAVLATWAVGVVAAAVAASVWLASASASSTPLTVTSTLDGQTTLPHRIRWQAFPSVPAAQVSAVDYLIDGRQLWVEHAAPYFYGSNAGGVDNYLVTSFLTPGPHQFVVKVVTTDGQTATDTVTATVPVAPAPPAVLAGTWKRFVKNDGAEQPRTGYWQLIISKVGWRFHDTQGTGAALDVAYPSPGLLEVETGMATGHPNFDLNAWCGNDPGRPVRFSWSVAGSDLKLRFVSGSPCQNFTYVTTGVWARVG